jgi:hypothetical protein
LSVKESANLANKAGAKINDLVEGTDEAPEDRRTTVSLKAHMPSMGG